MTKRLVTILGRFFAGIVSCLLVSCQGIGEEGYFLGFIYFSCDTLKIYSSQEDQMLDVVSDGEIRSDAYPYTSRRDREIENLISQYVDPTGKEYDGGMPISMRYHTIGCSAIHINVEVAEGNSIVDITDYARFYHSADYGNTRWNLNQTLLVTSDKSRVVPIPVGMTISEYLSYNPIVFYRATFSFPSIPDGLLQAGNTIVVEVELEDGTILLSRVVIS